LVKEGIEVEASPRTTFLNLAFDSKESNQTSHEPRLEISLSKIGPIGPILIGVELCVYVVATILFLAVERPFFKLRHRIVGRGSRH
jgi:hypothetical protein